MTAAEVFRRDCASPIEEFCRARAAFRSRNVRALVYAATICADIVALFVAFIVSNNVFNGATLRSHDVRLMLLTVALFFVASFYARTLSFSAMQLSRVAALQVFHAWISTLALVLLIVFTGKNSANFSRGVFLMSAIIGLFLLVTGRSLIVWNVRKRLKRWFICELFLEDGVPAWVPSTFDRVATADLALVPDAHDPISLHNFSCLAAIYDRVVVSCPPERREAWALYMQSVGCNGELVMPELEGIALMTDRSGPHLPTVTVAVGPLDRPNRILKRTLDLAVTVPLIIALSPLMLIVGVAVKLDSRGPILFRQQRMGRNNRLFKVYKFRSMMHQRSDFSGTRSAARDDDRVTRVGRIIRATSIDELPQLFNVLRGDMALVGPRPHALGSRAGDDLFWHIDSRYWLRHSIKPGITGLAQVRGYRGATDLPGDLSNRLRSDLEYLADWSIFRDIYILLRTAGVVIHNKAY